MHCIMFVLRRLWQLGGSKLKYCHVRDYYDVSKLVAILTTFLEGILAQRDIDKHFYVRPFYQ